MIAVSVGDYVTLVTDIDMRVVRIIEFSHASESVRDNIHVRDVETGRTYWVNEKNLLSI